LKSGDLVDDSVRQVVPEVLGAFTDSEQVATNGWYRSGRSRLWHWLLATTYMTCSRYDPRTRGIEAYLKHKEYAKALRAALYTPGHRK